jgi:membrane protease YdiL (CAAX protease family)
MNGRKPDATGPGAGGPGGRGAADERPFPSPLQASLLALLGIFVANLVGALLLDATSPTTAAGLATVIGLGAAGLLGATHVPPPHAARLGLRGLRLVQLVPLLLLVPVAVLAAELDPLLSTWWPAPDVAERAERMREALPTDERLALVETLVVAVGLAPLVEEWLFRGVIQQGLVAHMGARFGVVVTALLFALGHGGAGISAQSYAAIVTQIFVLGLAFGFVRQATGSLLAAILLHAAVNGLGVLSLHLGETVGVPGPATAAGAAPEHLPLALLAGCAASVALGVWWLGRIPPVPLRPEPPRADDESSWLP